MGNERLAGPVAEGKVINVTVVMISMHDDLHLLHGVLGLRFKVEVE
jgi:hypothetical protein